MNRSRLSKTWLPLAPAILLALGGCRPAEEAGQARPGGFDTTAEINRPEPARFGPRVETISPEAQRLIESAQGAGAGMSLPAASEDPGKWGNIFDGSQERAPSAPLTPDDRRIGTLMAGQGVRRDIVSAVLDESQRQGADPLLVFSVIKQESSFNPGERSPAGARGLMQVMPDTGRGLGVRNPSSLFDVGVNVHAGVSYLKEMFRQFSDVSMSQLAFINPFSDSGVKAAIAAYNAGPGAVRRYRGTPPFRETRDYVVKVLGNYQRYRSQLAAI